MSRRVTGGTTCRSALRAGRALAALAVAAALALTACGDDGRGTRVGPSLGVGGDEEQAARALGFPAFATKNTTRVGGADATATAAGVARAVFPGRRPGAIVLADDGDWHAAVAGAALVAAPVGAPTLLAHDGALPDVSEDALAALRPAGVPRLRGARVIRLGQVPSPAGLPAAAVAPAEPATMASGIDALLTRARGRASRRVLVVSAERPEFAVPAAAWAARSGDPVLFARRDALPRATRAALAAHGQPRVYVLGGEDVIGRSVERALRRLGTVRRIAAPDAVRSAIAFARYRDDDFGWGIVDPGHGLVLAPLARPVAAAVAAPLSGSGTYGPLLLLPSGRLAPPIEAFLLDIQPGYESDPVRGVYNHGWIIGDEAAVPLAVQARVDELLEIAPVARPPSTSTSP
jgi:hypothetical protein